MSAVLKEILDRAIDNQEFRRLLFNNPSEALSGYNLTEDERQRLSALNKDNFDEFAGPLSGRTTKGAWRPGTG